MTKFIYSWNEKSESAKLLSEAMGIRRIRHENSRFRANVNKTVINYGCSSLPDQVNGCRIINSPLHVGICSNKLSFFHMVAEENEGDGISPRCPPWTEDYAVALSWVEAGSLVCARTVLTGHSARGLVIMDRNAPETLVQAPLYVKYVPKKDEYRVHIVNGEVIDTQRKGISQEFKDGLEEGEEVNFKIRNLSNGFIFVRNDGRVVPDDVHVQAKLAIAAVGLDFGAVDIIYNAKRAEAYVLEINTAPGLMGTTVTNYATALGNMN